MKSKNGCGIGAEYPYHHVIQILFILFFVLIWLMDALFLRLAINWCEFLYVDIIRIIGFLFFTISAYFLIKKSAIVVKPETYNGNILITSGIYSRTRHPMYLGIIFIYLAFVFLTFSLSLFFAWIFIVIVHNKMVSYEEKDLVNIFGEHYKKYQQNVPKWFPDLF